VRFPFVHGSISSLEVTLSTSPFPLWLVPHSVVICMPSLMSSRSV
jgi:hypothetical protein